MGTLTLDSMDLRPREARGSDESAAISVLDTTFSGRSFGPSLRKYSTDKITIAPASAPDPLDLSVVEKPGVAEKRGFFGKMADWFFSPMAFEKGGKFYELMAVPSFKKIFGFVAEGLAAPLQLIGLDMKEFREWNFLKLTDRTNEGLRKFDRGTRANELLAAGFAFSSLLGATLLYHFNAPLGPILEHVAIAVLNLYLYMTHRYNRVRAHEIIEKREARENERTISRGSADTLVTSSSDRRSAQYCASHAHRAT